MRRVVGRVWGSVFLVSLGAGCGGGTGSGTGSESGFVSCTETESIGSGMLKLCIETTGNEAQALQQSCTGSVGNVAVTFADGPCSHVNALGACRITSGGITEDGWYYNIGSPDAAGDVGQTPADIQALCAEAGETYLPP